MQSSAETENRAMIRKIDLGVEKRGSIDAKCKECKQHKQTY